MRFIFILLICIASLDAYEVQIFSVNNGKGLETSRLILKEELQKLGHQIIERNLFERPPNTPCEADINIYFEVINTGWINSAKQNWFIPNPECYSQSMAQLEHIDLVVCRTRDSERIFQELGKKTFYLGFTSLDCHSDTAKDYSLCIHVAGGSPFKGTHNVIKAWEQNPDEMPFLVLIERIGLKLNPQHNINKLSYKLSLDHYRALQNRCGVHICASETEGFGHYLMEAMSTSAVVITTDAPPMNEFITDKRCLVPVNGQATCNLGMRYSYDPLLLETTIKNIMSLSQDELKIIGNQNRVAYLERTQHFQDNLKILMQDPLQD